MSGMRQKIQMARFQDNASEWTLLTKQLLDLDVAEGMKAACSGAVKAIPGSQIKEHAVALIVTYAPALAELDLRAAVDAAITAAIYSKPQSDLREQATTFIADQSEALAHVDLKLAIHCADFAVKWAMYNSELAREAAETRDRLSAMAQSMRA